MSAVKQLKLVDENRFCVIDIRGELAQSRLQSEQKSESLQKLLKYQLNKIQNLETELSKTKQQLAKTQERSLRLEEDYLHMVHLFGD